MMNRADVERILRSSLSSPLTPEKAEQLLARVRMQERENERLREVRLDEEEPAPGLSMEEGA